ncbi:MAG TPA: HAD-IB family hydrolase, partial [Propionibacteriaceae bacterium]
MSVPHLPATGELATPDPEMGSVGIVETGAARASGRSVIQADPLAAAFFDLDNTVVQGASLYHLAKGLYRRGFFPTRVILRGLWLQI